MQVMHTGFSSDQLFIQWQHITEQLQLLFGSDMEYVQPAAIFLCQLDCK